jgi:anti-sigma factor ChrR (cupin superfamily)
MPIIKIVNSSTGEEIEREMTAEEFAAYNAQIAEDETKVLAQQQAANAAAAAKAALLDKLGITEEEAKLLLGGN